MKEFTHTSGQFIEIEDVKIYYEELGNKQAPALVLLHGGLGNMEDLNILVPGLINDFRIIGIDSRGQGKSTLGSKKLTYEQIQLDIERVLQSLNIPEVTIMGFSDGGIAAYRIAAGNAVRAKRIITIGANGSTDDLVLVREIFQRITPEGWRKKFPETYNSYMRLNADADFDRLTTAIKNLWLDESSSGYPNEDVKQISCPALIVRGDDDHLFPRKSAAELADKIEKSMLLNIPFSGHDCFHDQPEIFRIVLNKFLGM